jgi:hypothetical protein
VPFGIIPGFLTQTTSTRGEQVRPVKWRISSLETSGNFCGDALVDLGTNVGGEIGENKRLLLLLAA